MGEREKERERKTGKTKEGKSRMQVIIVITGVILTGPHHLTKKGAE